VLGRVVRDTNLLPLAGVKVMPSGLPPVLYYLNDDATSFKDALGVPLTETSASGYFIAQAPPFTTTWNADLGGAWRVVGVPTGGVLGSSSLTVIIITMTQEFGE
jgi:hypothetical protein